MTQDNKLAKRLATYSSVSTELALLSHKHLLALLENALLGKSIGGTSWLLQIGETKVFVKKVRLTDIEKQPESVMWTANLFSLPTFCQYGIGSPGFGVWRELATHAMTTAWVIAGECTNFPLMYHWRVLPRPTQASPTQEQINEVERDTKFWENSPAVRARLMASLEASAEIVLFLEQIPENLDLWLRKQFAAGMKAAESASSMVQNNLLPVISFINSRGLFHFDAHFGNILTDGSTLYFADFGLAMSDRFELSDAERNFFREHNSYDKCYVMAHFAKWILYELFGADNYENILHEYAIGKNSRVLSSHLERIILRYVPIALVMSEFFSKLMSQTKKEPYPARELEQLYAIASKADRFYRAG